VHFLNPTALLYLIGLGFFFLLHRLWPEKKEKVVPALFLWEGLSQNDEASQLRQRFKPDVLFFLQLLTLVLLLFALLRPVRFLTGDRPGRMVVVIDCSASMLSTDLSPNRSSRRSRPDFNCSQKTGRTKPLWSRVKLFRKC